jgi:hypothetical protein
MTSIPLNNPNIDLLLKPFLHENNGEGGNLNDTPTMVVDSILVDFGCKYRTIVQRNEDGTSHTISIHIAVIGWEKVEKHCLQKLNDIFGGSSVFSREKNLEDNKNISSDHGMHPMDAVANGYNVCIQVRTNDQRRKEKLVLLSNIRQIVLGSQLQDAFHALVEKRDNDYPSNFKIPLQRVSNDGKPPQQFSTISCQSDRVTAVTPFVFGNEIDCALSRLFLQQFEQAQRKSMNERHGKNVPICDYRRSADPPREVRLEHGDDDVSDGGVHHAGYLSLTFLEHHIDSEAKQAKAISNVLMLLDFVDYHVKCSKSNIYSRMRSKKDALMKYLFDE